MTGDDGREPRDGGGEEQRDPDADESARAAGEGSRAGSATLPIVRPPDSRDRAESPPTVVGVLLAAGTSDRFGPENKLLASVEGEPIVRRAARTLADAELDRIVVVLGHEPDRVRGALEGLPVECVRNEEYERGQAASLRTGLQEVRGAGPGADAVVVALGDMPFVAPETISALVSAYRAGKGDALAAAYDGERGNPVLFDRRHFDALSAVDGDVGGREILLSGDRSALVAVEDPGVLVDVDDPETLRDVGNSEVLVDDLKALQGADDPGDP